ncbi:hypothetical protein [Thiolapillus sp.]|uniref:hypothetical protein n=1 Tax=Thiolapillus sp. TaxID=2017437 RepID=UPI003AF66C27
MNTYRGACRLKGCTYRKIPIGPGTARGTSNVFRNIWRTAFKWVYEYLEKNSNMSGNIYQNI